MTNHFQEFSLIQDAADKLFKKYQHLMSRAFAGSMPTDQEFLDVTFSDSFDPGANPQDCFNRMAINSRLRDLIIKEYGFGIPSRTLIEAMKPLGPVVDFGSGSGHYAKVLKESGVEVFPVDDGSQSFAFKIGRFTEVHRMSGWKALEIKRGWNIFASWPWMDHALTNMIRFRLGVGSYVIFIGEPGGCTARESFIDLISDGILEVNQEINIPKFQVIPRETALILQKVKPAKRQKLQISEYDEAIPK